MKELQDLFEHYEQNPPEEVWDRLSARLDSEMPTHKMAHRGISTAWKWAAAVAAVIVLGGAVAFGVFHNRSQKQQQFVENKKSVTTEEKVVVEELVLETESETEAMDKEQADPAVPQAEVRPSRGNSLPQEKVERPETTIPKTHVRQEVLPANSTLAKQLAADPVLKNLSDGSVDWSMPAHLSIPNLFTPNGDNVNDLFVIEGIELYASPRLVVRDKNNRIVYQSAEYRNSWSGENCPDGVYNYEFTFSYNGIENQATGKVRIIRS